MERETLAGALLPATRLSHVPATDACGNSTSARQTITVRETAPELSQLTTLLSALTG